jgi:hypothetical protein
VVSLLIFCGIAAVSCAGTQVSSLMREAFIRPVSIVSLAITVFLPLLISAFAVFTSRLWVLYPLAFYKAFVFSFSAYGALIAFGSAGWLIRFLLLFSDFLLLPVLYFFWHRQISGSGKKFKSDFTVCSLIAAAVCGLDLTVISQFLSGLTDIS